MKKSITIGLWISLTLGNYAYALLWSHNVTLATERTFFQTTALIGVFVAHWVFRDEIREIEEQTK